VHLQWEPSALGHPVMQQRGKAFTLKALPPPGTLRTSGPRETSILRFTAQA
jgi:hypothetical protein